MEIINNRYKMEECIEIDSVTRKYKAIDLIQNNQRVVLYIIKDNSYMRNFINYCIRSFYQISSLNHRYMIKLLSFGIVESIDDKQVYETMFYYTTEYLDPSLKIQLSKPLSKEKLLEVYVQVARLFDYLHFRGIIYKYLNPENLYIYEEAGKLQVKLTDLITVKLIEVSNKYCDEKYVSYKAPELDYEIDIGGYTDIYSLGSTLYSLHTLEEFQYNKLLRRVEQGNQGEEQGWEQHFLQIIKNATQMDFIERIQSIHQLNSKISSLYQLSYPIEDKRDVENLNFKIPLIGRDVELKKVLSVKDNLDKKNLLLLHGDKGIGKTRFINEIKYQMKWSRLNVFHHSISLDRNSFYKIITVLLKSILRIASPNIINKYAEELVKLIPEIGFNQSITPSRELRADREILRLYDRVTNFIIEAVGNHPTIMIVDDFHHAHQSFVEFLDYFIKINKLKKAPIIVLLSYSDEGFHWERAKNHLLDWGQADSSFDIKLSRLTVEETAKMVRHVLGWNKDPLRFATRIMKETEGNPILIEEALKELFAQKMLYVDYSTKEEGFAWQSLSVDYEKISLPENLDDAVINLLNTLDERTRKVLEIVSLFNTSVSREIISFFLGIDEDYSPYLNQLTQLKILNEKLEDWGYTYGFYRSQFKSYIYDSINGEEKIRLHYMVSRLLEEQYKREGRENKEELIYHLFQSNQRDKAIFYCIEAGDSMNNLRIYSQGLIFYKRAYELLEDSIEPRTFQLLLKIGEVYQNQGNNQEAINLYQKIISLCEDQEYIQYSIESRCRLTQIYINRNELDLGKSEIQQSIKMAEGIQYDEGLLKAGYLLSRIYMHQKEIDLMEEVCEANLTIAQRLARNDYIGMFMSQKGVIAYFKGDLHNATEYFKESVIYLEMGGRLDETSRPINNIGVILQDHFLRAKEAREYFERSAKIAQQYHRMDDLFRAQNNIADSYMLECQFEKAIDVLHNNIGLALEYEDEAMKLLGYCNLMSCYIQIGDYKQAYHYVQKVQIEFHDYPLNGLFADALFNAMILFYMEMGAYEKALELIDRFDTANQDNQKINLMMAYMRFYTNYYQGILENTDILLDVLEAYRNTTYVKDRRTLLLMSVEFFFQLKELPRAKDLLQEDESLKSSFDNYYFQTKRKYLECLLKNGSIEESHYWEDLSFQLMESYDRELKWKVYKRLGNAYFKEKDYYRATSCFLNSLEVIQSLLKRTPKEFKKSYLKVMNKYKIKEQLLNMKNIIQNSEEVIQLSLYDASEEVDQSLANFFDVSNFQELFKNPEFYNLALQQYKTLISLDIDNIDSLVASLSNDVENNLNLITKLAGKYTLATRGALLGTTEEGYEIVASFGQRLDIEDIAYLLEKSAVSKDGILIENHLAQGLEINGVFFNKEARGIICLPIVNHGKEEKSFPNNQRQGNSREKSRIAGYLYLETDKVFNNFSQETFKECKKLLPLGCIMLNNYYLQITSSIDKMTGAYVRKTIEKILQDNIEAAKDTDQIFSIVMCDIDHFKSVNDTYGHQKGDMVLAEVGRVIKSNIRATDFVGRYGGEEFIILLPNTNKQDAVIIAEKIRVSFKEASFLGDEVELTISCGVSCCPDDGLIKDVLIEKADQALYTAKEKGRNQTVYWEDGIGFVDKRTDKLAGIVTGNVVQDQRNVLVLAEAIEILTEKKTVQDKIFVLLGRLIEILEADEGIIFAIHNEEIVSQYCRKRFNEDWLEELNFNKRLIEKVIQGKQGEYLIDWEDISHIDIFTGTPNWKSVIVIPIIYNGELKGVIYLSVSVKEKEFDFNAYNLVKITSNIIGPILNAY